VVLGGQGEPIVAVLKEGYRADLPLVDALGLAIRGLGTVGGDNGKPRELAAKQLEVAVLDRGRPTRKFRRLQGAALAALLPRPAAVTAAAAPAANQSGSIDLDATEDPEEGSPS
jgi:proteasome alpha subunit